MGLAITASPIHINIYQPTRTGPVSYLIVSALKKGRSNATFLAIIHVVLQAQRQ